MALLCQTEAPPGKTEAQKMAANCDLSCFQEQAHLFGLIKLQNKTFGLELRELYYIYSVGRGGGLLHKAN